MSLNKFKELLMSESVFSFEEIWKSPTSLSKKYRTYLAPDSYAYHSVMNPIFSFEIEDHFEKFSLLSLRDGAYPLARFFFVNPEPRLGFPMLIVDSDLQKFVPRAWRNQVLLRKVFIENAELRTNELLLLISPDKDALPIDILGKVFEEINLKVESFETVSIYLSSCNFYGEEDPEYDLSWGAKILQPLLSLLPGKKIRILDFAEYTAKDMSHVAFHFLNPLKFYFSDSYLMHDLLQRGALSLLDMDKKKADDVFINISINHGFIISAFESCEEIIPDKTLVDKIFKGGIYRALGGSEGLEKLKLSTKEFKDWVSATTRQLFDKNNL